MNKLSTKLAAGVTLVSLGGLAGFAVKDNHSTASTAAQKQPPVQVRTQVIRRTVRIHRKPKAPKPAPRAAAPLPQLLPDRWPPRAALRPPPRRESQLRSGRTRLSERARAAPVAVAASGSTSTRARGTMTDRGEATRASPGAMPVVTAALGGFLILLTVLALQMRAGHDPALKPSAAAAAAADDPGAPDHQDARHHHRRADDQRRRRRSLVGPIAARPLLQRRPLP